MVNHLEFTIQPDPIIFSYILPIPPNIPNISTPKIVKIMNAGMEAIAVFTINMTIEINGIFTSTIVTLFSLLFSISLTVNHKGQVLNGESS